ncbi:MAG: M61 family peptidase [Cyanobacteria bacterium J055]|nr:MAG: M61 family peptidase [Cyanobacteria bacterium J055]
MTEAIDRRPIPETQTTVTLEYRVAMPQPESHLFEVTLRVGGWSEDRLDLKFPVWTPGSYLIREYAKHLQDFGAEDLEARSLVWRKVSKNHWQVETAGIADIVVRYRIFANELTVRTNHLDGTHGYFNGAALFFFVPGFDRQPMRVQIVPPHAAWRIAAALPEVAPQTFQAADFDELVDSPFEIGIHRRYDFHAAGKPHSLVVWGSGNLPAEKAIADIERIIEVEAELFGGLPYDRYLFLLHLSGNGFGGLEHKTSCTLNYPRLGFRYPDKYNRFMQLVAHEFFHLWNVKRIRPKELEVFDYEGENYTPSLWFCEGTTSYYDTILPYRAQVYDLPAFLSILGKDLSRFLTTPGRRVQPLDESSWDAWIKLYRRDANSDNSQISYYLKGEMVSFLLELLIRRHSDNRRSLDDVLRQLWKRFGRDEVGFSADELKGILETVANTNLDDFYRRYIFGTEELPFDEYLEPFGLKLKAQTDDRLPFLGMRTVTNNGRTIVEFVEAGSPAQKAGLDAGDELLAIDGIRVSGEQLNERLADYRAGDRIAVGIFHQDELRTLRVTLAPPRPSTYRLVRVDRPTATQAQLFEGWLGVSLSSL